MVCYDNSAGPGRCKSRVLSVGSVSSLWVVELSREGVADAEELASEEPDRKGGLGPDGGRVTSCLHIGHYDAMWVENGMKRMNMNKHARVSSGGSANHLLPLKGRVTSRKGRLKNKENSPMWKI